MHSLLNILRLGIKEFRSLYHDRAMLILIVWAFSFGTYTAASGIPEALHHAPLAIVDEDHSQLSERLAAAFQLPYFLPPARISSQQVDAGMDGGRYTFALDIAPDFQHDVLAGRHPSLQLNVDATQIGQAFTGAGYIQTIVATEVSTFIQGSRGAPPPPVGLATRMQFNPNLTQAWFTSVMQLIDYITMVSIILTGAALIREREHGTLEHLLVMPLRAFEIMLAKVWSMGLVVLLATAFAIWVVVRGWLAVPISGSIGLFLLGTALHLFATTSIGIYLGTVARSMPQLGLLSILILLPLQLLSGGATPRESMPELVQNLMLAAPTTHFVSFAQGILYRGAGLAIVWPQFLAIASIGTLFFIAALLRFRRAISQMA
ncbi:ABC transporter permease [Pseudomonas sp. P97.38]|uniref:ABC transporter permease n=1 Tax=Pseudomonas sp. P97.38 TaxID=255451 RepID=UPI00069F48F9|nr:ABC transporter permease [Pseudomonas sp. P97.38]